MPDGGPEEAGSVGATESRFRVPPRHLAAVAALLVAAGGYATWRARPGSETSRGDAGVQLVAPASESDATLPVTLRWRSTPGATGYRVSVLDARGAVVFELATADTSATLPTGIAGGGDATLVWSVAARMPDATQPRSAPARFHLRSR